MTALGVEPSQSLSVSLSLDRVEMVDKLAKRLNSLRPNRSAAIAHLVDLHAAVDIERLEEELLPSPYPVTEWAPPQLSETLIAYVAGLVRAGNRIETALNLAGVTRKQWDRWGAAGREDQARGAYSLEADFVAALAKAEAECEAEDIRRIRAHGQKNWRATAWRLERLYPKRYGQHKTVDGKIEHSLTPMVDWDRLSPSEARTLVELLQKASPDPEDRRITRTARPVAELLPGDVIDQLED